MQAAAVPTSAAVSSRCGGSSLPHSPSVGSSWHWALRAQGRGGGCGWGVGGVGVDRGLDGLRGRVCLTRKNGRGGERE